MLPVQQFLYAAKGAGRFVLSIADRIEIEEGEDVKAYLREKATYILKREER
jgi:hypothetical protein